MTTRGHRRWRGVLRNLVALTPGAAAVAAASAAPAADPRIVEGERAEALDRFLTTQADSGFNGSVLIALGDRPVLHKSYGWADLARSRPVTNDTPFWIASVSKQFTAAAILALAEDGVLSPEDSLGRCFDFIPEETRSITLHQLMTHTAGLTQRYAADGIPDREPAVRAVLDTALAYSPGTGFGYSNDAYSLLAAVVETASKESFEAFLRRRVLEPANLDRTGFWGPALHPEVAEIPDRDGLAPAVAGPNWGFRGGTGMYSTSGDLYSWSRALAGGKVLREAGVRRMQAAHVHRGELGVGYGWFTSAAPDGTPCCWTRGYESFGHGAYLALYPEHRLVIVVLSSSGERDGRPVSHRLAGELERLCFDSGTGPGN